ncbi:hypothetical protein NIES39_J05800 [Arthrospira platensis NIES-39]|nr:hypothetical protein NIES39_J05800 [Arthrospira platensis NIES-39]
MKGAKDENNYIKQSSLRLNFVGWVKCSETQHHLEMVALGFVTSTQPTQLMVV